MLDRRLEHADLWEHNRPEAATKVGRENGSSPFHKELKCTAVAWFDDVSSCRWSLDCEQVPICMRSGLKDPGLGGIVSLTLSQRLGALTT